MYSYLIKRLRKKLVYGVSKKSGHNIYGRITVFGQGGGKKEKLRIIDYNRIINKEGLILLIEKDIKRSGFLGLIYYNIGIFSYILLGEFSKALEKIPGYIKDYTKVILNASYFLKNLLVGTEIYNIEKNPGKGAIFARAAGVSSFIYSKKKNKVILKMNSGWLISLSSFCISVLGKVSNVDHKFYINNKAGNSRLYGKRPKVRGVAMNPCDHPHGGGEGKKSQPAAPYSRFGKRLKFKSTKNKKYQLIKKKNYKLFK